MMRWIIVCERSARVRDAMRKLGHDAWSCDVEPCDADPAFHMQCDAREVLDGDWDGMICHPPCTYLCVSGLHWNKRRPQRATLTEEALEFVKLLLGCKIPMIALENPVGCISTRIRPPDQIIQPWQFGHPESKATCLWLKNLPPLVPTNIVKPRYLCACGYRFEEALGKYGCPNCEGDNAAILRWENQTPSGQNKLGPSPERARLRSLTYQGIADAMAAQWGAKRNS